MKFDVIVGNPPYQGAKSTGGKAGKPPTIWPKFVQLGNELLTDDGIMVMVHPAMYRKPGNVLQPILHNNNRELHMYNNAEAIRTFGANTRYDWYVIDKTYTGPTDVYFEDLTHQQVDLTPDTFMPNGSWTIWQKCLQLADKHGGIVTTKKTDRVTGDGPYKVVQTITKTKGTVIVNTDRKPKAYGIPKVLLSETGCMALADLDGTLGMSCNVYYVSVDSKEEAEALVRFVNSSLCDHLVESCKWSNFRTEHCLWHRIPNPYALGITADSSESDIYDAFGLDADERCHVGTFIYGKARPAK